MRRLDQHLDVPRPTSLFVSIERSGPFNFSSKTDLRVQRQESGTLFQDRVPPPRPPSFLLRPRQLINILLRLRPSGGGGGKPPNPQLPGLCSWGFGGKAPGGRRRQDKSTRSQMRISAHVRIHEPQWRDSSAGAKLSTARPHTPERETHKETQTFLLGQNAKNPAYCIWVVSSLFFCKARPHASNIGAHVLDVLCVRFAARDAPPARAVEQRAVAFAAVVAWQQRPEH